MLKKKIADGEGPSPEVERLRTINLADDQRIKQLEDELHQTALSRDEAKKNVAILSQELESVRVELGKLKAKKK
jgi:hypothetical protein